MDIATIRKTYPQYGDLTDEQIARGMHKKYYSDMEFDDFASRIGFKPEVIEDVSLMKQMGQAAGVGMRDALHGESELQRRTRGGPKELNPQGGLARLRERSMQMQSERDTERRKAQVEEVGKVWDNLPTQVEGDQGGILRQAAIGLAGSAPGMAMTAVPGAGTAQFFGQFYGEKDKQLLEKGVTDDEVRHEASLIRGALGTLAEQAGNLAQFSAAGKILGKAASKLGLPGKVKKYLGHIAESMAEEGAAEYADAYADLAADVYAANPDAGTSTLINEFMDTAMSAEFQGQALHGGAVGAVSGAFIPGGAAAVKAPFDYFGHRKAKLNEKAITQDVPSDGTIELGDIPGPGDNQAPADIDVAIGLEDNPSTFTSGATSEDLDAARREEQDNAVLRAAQEARAQQHEREQATAQAAAEAEDENQQAQAQQAQQYTGQVRQNQLVQQVMDATEDLPGTLTVTSRLLHNLEQGKGTKGSRFAKIAREAHQALAIPVEDNTNYQALQKIQYKVQDYGFNTQDPLEQVLISRLDSHLSDRITEMKKAYELDVEKGKRKPGILPSQTDGKKVGRSVWQYGDDRSQSTQQQRVVQSTPADTGRDVQQRPSSVQQEVKPADVQREADRRPRPATQAEKTADAMRRFKERTTEKKPFMGAEKTSYKGGTGTVIDEKKADQKPLSKPELRVPKSAKQVQEDRVKKAEPYEVKAKDREGKFSTEERKKLTERVSPKNPSLRDYMDTVREDTARKKERKAQRANVQDNGRTLSGIPESVTRGFKDIDPTNHSQMANAEKVMLDRVETSREFTPFKKKVLKERVRSFMTDIRKRQASGEAMLKTSKNPTAPTGKVRHAKTSAKKVGKFSKQNRKAVYDQINQLQSAAAKAAKAVVVETQDQLPEAIRQSKDDTVVEAAWDGDQVYFVAENIPTPKRAVELWLHEQVGHKGLMELFDKRGADFNEFLDFAYGTIKRQKKLIAEIESAYAKDLKKLDDTGRKRLIVEEVMARRAEKLNPYTRKRLFQKFLEWMNKWIKNVTGYTADKVPFTMKDLDTLLEVAKNRLIHGELRDWMEFKESDKTYKEWAKEVLAKNPAAISWYTNHYDLLEREFGKDAQLMSVLLGITSPRAKVHQNAMHAVNTYLYMAGKRSKPGGMFPQNVKKVVDRIKSGDMTFSEQYKVDEFVRGLLGDEYATTNDMWMHRAFFGPALLSAAKARRAMTKKDVSLGDFDALFSVPENTASRHKLFQLTKELTDETGHPWRPRDLQAAIWMKIVADSNGVPIEELDYDYAGALENYESPAMKGMTPLEFAKDQMGDQMGQLHKKFKLPETMYPEISKLDELYTTYATKKGVKPVRFSLKSSRHIGLRHSKGIGGHLKEWAQNTAKWFDKSHLSEMLFDQFHHVREIEDAAGGAGASMSGWKSLRLMQSLGSTMGTMLREGTLVYDDKNHWVKLGDRDGGFMKVFEGMNDDTFEKVRMRLLAERVDTMLHEKKLAPEILERIYGDDENGKIIDPRRYTDEILRETADLKDSAEYAKVRAHLKKYNNSVLDLLEKSGIISPEKRDEWSGYATYVPLNRILDDEEASASTLYSQEGVVGSAKALKGSAGYQIGDPLDNLLANYSYLVNQAMKNIAYKKVYASASQAGVMAHEKIPRSSYMQRRHREDFIVIRTRGKEQYIRVDDARLFHALADANDSTLTLKVLNTAKKWLTFGVTVSPAFRIRNFMRDTMHTWVLMGKVNPIDAIAAGVDVFKNHKDMADLRAMGAAFTGSYYNADSQSAIGKVIDAKRKPSSKLRSAIGVWERLGEAAENANRLALYRKLRTEGATDLDAAFEAKDLLDFSSTGKSKIARFLISIVPFMNARLQGLHKLGRQMTGPERAKMIMRASAVATASVALHALNVAFDDDDEYAKIPNNDRWTYWHFTFGDSHIAVPKPFEIGAVCGELPVQMVDAAYRKLVKDDPEALKDLWAFTSFTFGETFMFDPLSNPLVKTYRELKANKDFFRGRPIEDLGLERLDPEMRWDYRTSKFARELGKAIGYSPKRIDHIVRGVFGFAGQASVALADQVIAPWAGHPDDPALTTDSFYWLHGRIPRGKSRYIKQEQEFWQLLSEADRAAASFNKLKTRDKAEARTYRDENRSKLRSQKGFTRLRTGLTKLKKKEQQIYLDKDLSADAKREKLDELVDRRQELILKHLKRLKDVYYDVD